MYYGLGLGDVDSHALDQKPSPEPSATLQNEYEKERERKNMKVNNTKKLGSIIMGQKTERLKDVIDSNV